MKKKITIKDIANELGIHHATVSRALRNDSRISQSTKDKIVSYAKSKGYKLNQSAVNLRNTHSNEIAVIVPNISHYTFANFVSVITDLAARNNFIVSMFQTRENYEYEKDAVKTIMQNRVAGVIASLSLTTTDTDHFKDLIEFGIPVVFFDRVPLDIKAPKVTTDNFKAAYDCVNLLINKGFKKIAHLTGPLHISVFNERNNGYQNALNDHAVEYANNVVIPKEFEISDGFDAIQKLWQEDEKPDAVLCDSFTLSAGVNMFCRNQNIIVPDNLGIIAIANDPFSALLESAQTIMSQPINEMAKIAFDLLIQCTKSEIIDVTKSIQPELIIRKSV